ncbi:MAG: molybdopterin-dependent oxidoreductase, partial [Planctomycetales bacterium]|nr:molybdopterin-dependent oxidoreductase [Planctomycetales bacterium]
MSHSRRNFLRACMGGGGALLAAGAQPWAFSPLKVENPLGDYPNRDWEKVYLDQYRYDESFTWVCAPNDTHMCRLRAFVRNGIMVRSEQNYDHDRYGDLYGNKTTKAWNPRGCPKGYTMQRRIYGPYRLKGPVLRKGWKDWVDAGCPSLSDQPQLRSEYKFDDRGGDSFVRVSWDEVSTYMARALKAISTTYSGPDGAARLTKDGYEPLMVDKVEGAGTRVIKFGSNLPIHGVVGKFGIYRFANLLGLLDHHVRGVPPEEARGARDWSEYTWRGDQAPGHPYVHGLQTSDMDFNDMRFSKLIIQIGKNLIENKMPESHWLNECMERGAKLVDIAPEYNCPATKSDYFIGVRAGLSDTSVLLGVTKIML